MNSAVERNILKKMLTSKW